MKKVLKQVSIFILFLVLAGFIITLVMPTHQKIEKTVTINAGAAKIYDQLKMLANFHRITVWNHRDSAVVNTISGTDGTVGATSSWSGDPMISGTGNITITELEPGKKIGHAIEFKTPKKGTAQSTFYLHDQTQATTVTWNFVMRTPRPWNVFNLFYSLEKQVGPDFEQGLVILKKMIEGSGYLPDTKDKVKPVDFPATTYAVIKQTVGFADIMKFYNRHWEILQSELQLKGLPVGARTGIVFEWNEKEGTASLGAAIQVPPGTSFENPIITIESIPASKAISLDHEGLGDRAMENFHVLRKYMNDHDLKEAGPKILQYHAGRDSSETRIIFIVD